jgi:hypothetical protein
VRLRAFEKADSSSPKSSGEVLRSATPDELLGILASAIGGLAKPEFEVYGI